MQRLGKAVHGRGWKLLRNDFVLWYPHVGNSVGSQQDWQGEIVAQLRGTSDGEYPLAGVIVDAKGNVYGTTETGGSSNVGTVYRVSESGKFTFYTALMGRMENMCTRASSRTQKAFCSARLKMAGASVMGRCGRSRSR